MLQIDARAAADAARTANRCDGHLAVRWWRRGTASVSGASDDAGVSAAARPDSHHLPLFSLLAVQIPHWQEVPAPLLVEVSQYRAHPVGSCSHGNACVFCRYADNRIINNLWLLLTILDSPLKIYNYLWAFIHWKIIEYS